MLRINTTDFPLTIMLDQFSRSISSIEGDRIIFENVVLLTVSTTIERALAC